ncbi:hypothetical protein RKD27_003138 [Streptomyces sp. SAI-126]
MQHCVGDAAELETEVPLAALGADDQEVGIARGVDQHPAGVALDGTPVHIDVRREVLQRCFEFLGGPLLVQARAGSPASSGWSVVSCAGQRQARTASRGTPRRRASSAANLVTAADSFASSPTPSTTRLWTGGVAWLSWLPRSTITGQSAWAATARLTEPSSISAMPLRPRVPTTTAEACRASRTRAYSGSSNTTSVLICRPGWRARAR